MKKTKILTGLFAYSAGVALPAILFQASTPSSVMAVEHALRATTVSAIVNGVEAVVEFRNTPTKLANVRSVNNRHEPVTPYLAFSDRPGAGEITSGRARALVGAVAGLISLIIGALACARSSGRTGRPGAIVALGLGLIGMILSVVHLSQVQGGFGTGGGRAGAIVGLVLALIGMALGGLALARSRNLNTTH